MSCPVSWGSSHATAASSEAADPKAPKAQAGKKQSWPPKEGEQGPWQEDTQSTEGLSAVVVSSNIPKAGTDGNWDFPSPQRFYNALKKKGYEASTQDILEWEALHEYGTSSDHVYLTLRFLFISQRGYHYTLDLTFFFSECKTPKLKRFKRVYGTPEELSPKSRMMQLFGYTGLFDRHDWVVDRCGKEVRYVIDFWRGKQVVADIPSIYLDVRPALDDFGAAWDHVRKWYRSVVSPSTSTSTWK